MKKFLPKTLYNPQGFTLIELLVVVAIIAILAIVGITLFTATQNKARDSKRIQDITSMSKAMEVNYKIGSGYPTAVAGSWFSDGVEPKNPAPGGAPYSTTNMSVSTYTFCAALENSTGNATDLSGGGLGATNGGFFCKSQNQ